MQYAVPMDFGMQYAFWHASMHFEMQRFSLRNVYFKLKGLNYKQNVVATIIRIDVMGRPRVMPIFKRGNFHRKHGT